MTASALGPRLQAGEIILIDGGTGTHIETLGGSTVSGLWSGAMAVEHPDLVRQAHLDYIASGAELVIANTYASSKHLLERAGFGTRFEEINRRSVELAIEARVEAARPDVLVAGSISSTEMQGEPVSAEELAEGFHQQAAVLREAGADLIVLEMMRDVETTSVILDAVDATGLAVWVGFSCWLDDAGTPVLFRRENTLAEGLGLLEGRDVEAVAIMHTEVGIVDACLDVVDANWDGTVGVYAHVGDFVDFVWYPDETFTPEVHTAHNERWIGRGVQIVGGCCGLGPAHIADLQRLLD